MSQSLTGVKTIEKKKKSTSKRTLHYFFGQYKALAGWAALSHLLVPVAMLCDTYLSTFLLSLIINNLTSGEFDHNQPLNTFAPLIAGYLGLMAFAKIFLWRFLIYCNWKFELRANYNLYKMCFDALQQKSLKFYANRFSGSIVSAADKFSISFSNIVGMMTFRVMQLFSAVVCICFILGPILPLYTLLLMICSALFVTFAFFGYKKIAHYSKIEADIANDLSGQISDNSSNITAVKSFAKQRFEAIRFYKKDQEYYDAGKNVMKAFIIRDIGFGFVMTAMAGALIFTIVTDGTKPEALIGPLVLAITYSMNLLENLWGVTESLRVINRSLGSASAMTEILDTIEDVEDQSGAQELKVDSGKIEFKDVSFAYHEDTSDEQVFENLNLTIKPGQRVGIVGHSGSGKTTLTKMLLRFYDIDNGEIAIDGQNIQEVTSVSHHRAIAYVPQEPQLFHRTMRENIEYGLSDEQLNLSESQKSEIVKNAAKLARADEFIDKLSDGYETMAGEHGVKLSGGQRQRIAIARAIAANAPIILLDEATSALDTISEQIIQEAMEKLMQGRTSIVIAHRLSTVASLDRIIVLEEGKIVEDGTHDELLEKSGVYADLWNRQTGMINEEFDEKF
jgi:ATP-binding cassette subfamily B protein